MCREWDVLVDKRERGMEMREGEFVNSIAGLVGKMFENPGGGTTVMLGVSEGDDTS
jgi:hypothetical protein